MSRFLIVPFAAIALTTLLAILPSETRAGTLVVNRSILHDGVLRWFDVYEPDGLGSAPVPVVLLLHGGTQNKASMRNGPAGELLTIADREGFLVLIPNGTEADGTTGLAGSYNWNDCRGDAIGILPESDDVGFVSALLDWTETEYPVDADRIYATGASNGGMMSYRLAFQLSDRLAGIASLIANLPAVTDCPVTQPATPISVMIMNGTEDPLVPWEGGPVAFDEGPPPTHRGTVISGLATRDFWRDFLMTDVVSTYTLYPDAEPLDAGRIESDLYENGLEGTELLFYTAIGAGHNYPSLLYPLDPGFFSLLGEQNQDVESAEEVWTFLSRQRRVPEPGLFVGLMFGAFSLSAWGRRRLSLREARRPEHWRSR